MANQDITLTLVPDPSGQPMWEMTYGGLKYGSGKYPTIDLKHNSGEHDFSFKIVNSGNITFKNGTGIDSPIWIQEGTQKPAPGVVNSQIEKIDVDKATMTTLTFKDKNHGAERTLTYQLNFKGANPLDPIIQNGGGTGPGKSFESYAFYGVAALLLLLVIALVYIRNRK